jgi:HK97 family phage major capsid protein
MTPPTTTDQPSLVTRLKEIQASTRALRDELGEARREASEKRDALAASTVPTAELRNTPEWRAAERARATASDLQAQVNDAQEAEGDILRLLVGDDGGPAAGGNGPQDGVSGDDVRALVNTPGALLSSILDRRKADIPTLPDHIRHGASSMAGITSANVSTITESTAIIDLLTPLSVAIASGINVLRLDTTKTRVPRFTELPVAAWIPELGDFPINPPGIEMVDVEPPKVGLITELSLEVFEDLRPMTLAMLQLQLLRAIALKFDAGILFGDGGDDGPGGDVTPLGVFNTTGIGFTDVEPLTSLTVFANALAMIIGSNARPGALAMNPIDVGTLLALTESADGAGSNVPLWKASVGSPSGLRLPYFDTPIWPTPACPRGKALLYDPSTVIVVIRREADIAIDPYYGFGNGVVGLRSYLRGDVVVGQAEGAVRIEFPVEP